VLVFLDARTEEIMARTQLRWGPPAALGICLMIVVGPLLAQGSQNPDVLASLLAEVRGLRAAMEQVASVGPRVQLSMGRLQLQEQRVTAALRKVDDLHERRTDAERDVAQMRSQIAHAQEMMEKTPLDSPERQTLEAQNRALREAVGIRASDVQRLASEEADAASALAAEQGRWNDINQRLEDLERALAHK
jgi:chromosome segregation ATPase